jgi:hypothetical protein
MQKFLIVSCRVARFFLRQHTKTGKNIPRTIPNVNLKYRNGCKIDQISIKITNIFHSKALEKLPKFAFLVWKYTIGQTWFHAENIQFYKIGPGKDIFAWQRRSALFGREKKGRNDLKAKCDQKSLGKKTKIFQKIKPTPFQEN